jgi:uncharacterized delta-60 repeat protein
MRVRLVLVALLALLVVAAPAAAAQGGGRLDTSFGQGGKVTVAFPPGDTGTNGPQYELPFSFTPGHLEMAKAPGGKIVVAGATKVVRYLADGSLDKSFGNGGTASVPQPPGGVFVLAAVAVDSTGRVVLGGLAREVPPNSTPDPVQSSATLVRLNADGSPDSGFGADGVLITNFGIPAPKAAGPTGRYPRAAVGIDDIAIDPQNRILVTGGAVTELGGCSRSVNSEGFVTRLTETGQVDPGFQFHLVDGLARLGQIEPRPAGFLALSSGGPLCSSTEGPSSVLIGIQPGGDLDSDFASFGFRTVDFAYPPVMALTPTGKILLMGHPYRITIGKGKKRHKVRVQTIERLLPNGAFDPGFKRSGRVNIELPEHGSLAAMAVDPRGRILLAGALTRRVSKSPKNPLRRSTFLVSRLDADGAIDRGFGHRGSLTTGFGGPSNSFATQVTVDAKGRILVGGGISAPNLGSSGGGFALARYTGG